jgi:dimethylaniline monooxygenase (N-oxide forming)
MIVAVVGAGPSGLVTAKTLKENGFEVVIYESADSIGGTFKYRSYENAELVSSRQLTAFSDFRIPVRTDGVGADHVSLEAYVQYLESYAQNFSILQLIQFNNPVVNISKSAEKYIVSTNSSTKVFDAVAVCSGLHVHPNCPSILGLDYIPEVIHSSQYKQRSQLTGKDVLVLGLGETSMDISYESIQAGANSVHVAHRHGCLSFPKRFNDFQIFGKKFDAEVPIDTLISNFAECAYVPAIAKHYRLRWHFSDVFVRLLLKTLTGTDVGANQWVAPAEKVGRAYNFLNKSTKAMPYINSPYKKHYWWDRFFKLVEPDTKGKVIHIRPWPTHISSDGVVHFLENDSPESKMSHTTVCQPNLIIFATGYTQDFAFLDALLPRPEQLNVRDVIQSAEPHIAFIGHVRPNVGAIPPIAEMQAMWWVRVLQNKLDPSKLIEPEPHWRLLSPKTKRIQYGIDHSSYVYQLAKDTGSTPSFFPPSPIFYRQPKLALAYAMAASFNTCFRLVGPFAFPEAPDIVLGELFETVTRRGVYGNVVMSFIPMCFYALANFMLFIFESFFGLIGVKFHSIPN